MNASLPGEEPVVDTARWYERGVLATRHLVEAPRYSIGVDLGQSHDFTAIVVLERARLVLPERDPVTYQFRTKDLCVARHVEKLALGTPYPDIAERLHAMVKKAPLAGRSSLVVDATGVGAPVVDLLRRQRLGCRLVPVVITGGGAQSQPGDRYHVPRRDLLVGLQVGFQGRSLAIAGRMRGLPELREELEAMRVKVREDGSVRYTGRGHDDMVLAMALAWWWTQRGLW